MQNGRIARKRGIKVVEGMTEDLPFEDESFNFVLMVTTICFLDIVEKGGGTKEFKTCTEDVIVDLSEL